MLKHLVYPCCLGGQSPWVCVLVIFFLASPVQAARCGDNVDGARVPCACGDVVVSDTLLQSSDPVVRQPCDSDGLVIRAPRGAESISLDLGGLSIAGRGLGTGIRVIHGGSLGATIRGGDRGGGRVVGFTNGIKAAGRRSLAVAEGLHVTGNLRDGIVLRGVSAEIAHLSASGNGRHGIWMRSLGGSLNSVVASDNAAAGLSISGSSGTVEATLSGNAGGGLIATGREHDLGGVEAIANAASGIYARGRDLNTAGARSLANGAPDVISTMGRATP